MGNTLSSIFNKSYVQYEITEDIVVHPLVGQFLVLRDVITENFIFGIEINMSELEIQDYAELERHQLFAHVNILRFEGFKKLDDENYLTLFESYEYTLEEEIQARKEQNKRFTENEVLGLLQNISAALAYFQKKGVYHGQVTAENIVKKGEDYKLIDPVIFENYETTYGRILQGEDDQVRLLSPELMKALKNNDMDPEYEEYKQDVYALGVIILDAIVLDTAIPLPKKFQFAADYSKSIMQILNQMVEADPLERIDAISCSKVIENIYYGFPMSDDADANSVPAEVTNQVKSVLPGYYDLEISPGKEESSPQRQSASGKKSKRVPFQQLMEKMNERSSSTNSAPQEAEFSHYISLDYRAKSNPVFSIQPQSLSQSYQEQVSQDDKHGFLKTANQHKKMPEHSESYSDHISYKYTATNQSQDALPSSFSKDTNSHNKTVASHLNTQSVDFLYSGPSRSNTLHTLSQEPKKEDLNYTTSDDFHQSALKEPTETLGQVTKNAGSKALYGILGDTYSSRLHARNYSNPIEHSSKKLDAAESLSRHGHEAKSITVNSRGDFISEIISNKDATSPKANLGSVSYHHSRQSSHQQHGSHQRSDSNIFGTQPKILVESYYLHGEGSPEQSPQKYQDIVGNIVSESASPERAQERMTTSPQKENVQFISLDNNTPASKRNFQTFRAQGGSEVPLETVVSIPISPNQEYERLMSLYLPDRTPHNLEELARSIESLNTTSNAQAVKPFAAVLEETHHSHHPENFHNEYLKGTETSQHLTYTASVDYPTEMSHASPGSPPQQTDPAAYQSNIAYQTFNPKVWNPQLRTENLSNQSPSPKKLHEPILRNTGQTGDYVPSFNSYRAQMDFQPSGHADTYDRYNNTMRYQDKSSLHTIIENVSTHQGLDHTGSVQLTNPNEYASNKTEQLFTTSPDNMKYRDYLTGSIDFPSKGLSTINVQTSYQATEYIPRNTVESLSPGDGYKGYLYTDYNAYGSPGQQYGESSVKTYPRDSAHPLDIGSGSKQSQVYKYSVGDLDDHYDSLGTVVNMASVDHDPQSLKEAEMTLRAMEWQKTKNALNRSRAKLRQSVIEEDDSFIDKRFEQIEMLISTVDKLSHKRVQYPPKTTERDITKLKEMARKSISISTTSFSTSRFNEHGSRHRISLFDGRTTVNGLFNTPGS